LGLTEEGNDQVLVLYYAFYGHIEKMAQSVEEGACVSQLALEQRNEQGAWRASSAAVFAGQNRRLLVTNSMLNGGDHAPARRGATCGIVVL
jgi:hypothetical protein